MTTVGSGLARVHVYASPYVSHIHRPDDFESSPVLTKRARQVEGSGCRAVASQAQGGKGGGSQQQEPAGPSSNRKTRPSRGERQFNKDTEKALRESTRESTPSSGTSLPETTAPEQPLVDTPPTKQSHENGIYHDQQVQCRPLQ